MSRIPSGLGDSPVSLFFSPSSADEGGHLVFPLSLQRTILRGGMLPMTSSRVGDGLWV